MWGKAHDPTRPDGATRNGQEGIGTGKVEDEQVGRLVEKHRRVGHELDRGLRRTQS
jgi:hypothetical protein